MSHRNLPAAIRRPTPRLGTSRDRARDMHIGWLSWRLAKSPLLPPRRVAWRPGLGVRRRTRRTHRLAVPGRDQTEVDRPPGALSSWYRPPARRPRVRSARPRRSASGRTAGPGTGPGRPAPRVAGEVASERCASSSKKIAAWLSRSTHLPTYRQGAERNTRSAWEAMHAPSLDVLRTGAAQSRSSIPASHVTVGPGADRVRPPRRAVLCLLHQAVAPTSSTPPSC